MKSLLTLLALAAAVAGISVAASFAADGGSAPTKSTSTDKVEGALGFTMKDIDGKDVPLSKYKGSVVMMVNVASKCGNTPQYTPLEAMYSKYKDKGLVIMGFPANNFGGQEPGTNEQIKEFCEETYKVAFPMFGKISVKGADQDPLFKYLTSQDVPVADKTEVGKGDIAWNFEKFLLNRKGVLIARFANKTKPDDPAVVKAVEAALAEK